jgi:hypothetical protein
MDGKVDKGYVFDGDGRLCQSSLFWNPASLEGLG